jgi:hypothetical protein
LVGKPEGKRVLGRPRRRWEDGIKTDVNEIGFENADLIYVVRDKVQWRAVVNTVMNRRGNFLIS